MDRMDTIIAGSIGMLLVVAFLIGLAESIGAIPFWIITVGVLVMGLINYYEECVRKKRNNNAKTGAP